MLLLCSIFLVVITASSSVLVVEGRLPSRDRIVQYRLEEVKYNRHPDNVKSIVRHFDSSSIIRTVSSTSHLSAEDKHQHVFEEQKQRALFEREIIPARETSSTKNSGSCCSSYSSYNASDLCGLYGQDCAAGYNEEEANDDNNQQCNQDGLAFIGVSFSVNTQYGNPYSFQLCDQFPMDKLIDRSYEYIMSMDEDGWLAGGGYKQFDSSGKMPYIDSSHTELLRIGSLDVSKGGTSLSQVYAALYATPFEPFAFYPEMVKLGGNGGNEDNNNKQDDSSSSYTPSYDITLAVSMVEVYADDDATGSSYSTYETFVANLFLAIDNNNGGDCVDDEETEPHVSIARGVKFKSSYLKAQYLQKVNLEVAVWQAMYPMGVVIGSSSTAKFGSFSRWKSVVGYGNLYLFYNRNNITKSFSPSQSLSSEESHYSTFYKNGYAAAFYANTTDISFSYQEEDNEDNNDESSWEYNPYAWKKNMAMNDPTNGLDLPPNCQEEGETFLGIPLSRLSASNLQSTKSFQEQFDFDLLLDRNNSYIVGFGTNHGWLVGGENGKSGEGSIVEIDTAHIPLFYLGTTNSNMGGMSLSNMIKVLKTISFGTLYIKPAFVFIDSNGHLKLQFEADSASALGYLYNNLCASLGIQWDQRYPKNNWRLYTKCAMHAAGDRAIYGCGPSRSNAQGSVGGFCPQMTLAYSPKFSSEESAAAYITKVNNYVDYWRSLYPSGVATGTSKFCSKTGGGCLGLFLNRMDLYYVFSPNLSGSWVEYASGSATAAPTHSPAPTFNGGCDDPRNKYIERCSYMWGSTTRNKRASIASLNWDSFGKIGQLLILGLGCMSLTIFIASFIAHVRRRQDRKLEDSSRKGALLDEPAIIRRKHREIV